MKDKKQRLTILIISILVLTIGLSYAYYSAVVQGTGNANAKASGKTATIGEVEFNGTKTFATTVIDEIYPGFIGIQEFTVGPYKDGIGIYEVDLSASVPQAFGNDIRISVYKTSDKTNNNVTRTEGETTITNNQYTKQDVLTINGVPEKVYEGTLKTTSLEVVEQLRFTILNNAFTTPSVTPDAYYTYYAVYEYLDNGNQNSQQGLDFEGKFTVRYVTDNEYNAASYITSLVANANKGSINVIDNGTDASGCTNTLAYDDYGNLRYVGTNPCNYVLFNGESTAPSNPKYEIYLNGVTGQYDDLASCEVSLSNNFLGVPIECYLNEGTDKYEATMDGFASTLGSFNSSEECIASNYYSMMSDFGTITAECRQNTNSIRPNGWRIIGVVDGKLKIIRSNSIGEYSWDSSDSSVNSGWGINQWGESGTYNGADLMKLLNPDYEDNTDSLYTNCTKIGNTSNYECELENASALVNNSLYWNKSSGKCFNDRYNQYTNCDFSENGLNSVSKNMIDNHMWYLGALGSNDLSGHVKNIYSKERGVTTGNNCEYGDNCNDNVIRTLNWSGYVGLPYISDYGYSIGGNNRINCLQNINLSPSDSSECHSDAWINGDYSSYEHMLVRTFITPFNQNTTANNIMMMISTVIYTASGIHSAEQLPVLPAAYLKSNVKIIGGAGTPENPFVLSQ